MRSLRRAGVLGVLVAIALIGASPASAATEAGDDCVANTKEGAYTLVPLERVSPSPIPLTAPVNGVVTSWKVNSGVSEGTPEQVRVLRPTGTPNEFFTVGESTEQTVLQGANVFPTRIPVQAGDHFGVFGTVLDVVFCGGADVGDTAGFFVLSAAVGSAHVFTPTTNVRIPMIAVIEPDKDGDGFGDETQDKCPQSAATQGECPPVQLSAVPVVEKNSLTILVSVSAQSTVTVSEAGGKLGRTPRAGIGRYPSLGSAVMSVAPGQIARFKFYFYRTLKSKLKSLSRKKTMKLRFDVSASNLTGGPTRSTVVAKLKGTAKPQPGRQVGKVRLRVTSF
jgi:hypothetical protein